MCQSKEATCGMLDLCSTRWRQKIVNVYGTECDVIYIKPNYIRELCGTMSCNIYLPNWD